MELKDTIVMMSSSNYKERFKAEYFQLLIRLERLENMLENWDEGKLDFVPTTPRDTYHSQLSAMKEYLTALEVRAAIEDIDLYKGEDRKNGI